MRFKTVALSAAFIVLAIGVTACGKRGPLEPPPKAEKTAAADSTAAAEDAEVIEERKDDVEEPHKPFILDVLL